MAVTLSVLGDGVARLRCEKAVHCARPLVGDAWEVAQIYKAAMVAVDADVRRAKVLDRKFAPELYDEIEREVLEDLSPLLKSHFHVQYDTIQGSQLVRYECGDFFSPHIDSGKTYPERVLTVIKYLSDEFSGGETYFPDLNLDVKVLAQDYLVFYPEVLHGARPVSAGQKTVFVSWLCRSPIQW